MFRGVGWPGRRPPAIVTVVSVGCMLFYVVYAMHAGSAPSNPNEAVATVQADLTGQVTTAYQGTTDAIGQIDEATCAPVGTLPGNLNCVVLLGGHAGAYQVTVVVDSDGHWRQLCRPSDRPRGQLCQH